MERLKSAPSPFVDAHSKAGLAHENVGNEVIRLFEKKKVDLLEQYADQRRILHAGGEVTGFTTEQGTHPRTVIFRDGNLYLLGKRGSLGQQITEGDLAVAPLWGMQYRLGDDVPDDIRTGYVESSFHAAMNEYTDRQIIEEKATCVQHRDTQTGDAYRRIRDEIMREGKETAYRGLLAERMVKSMFIRMCTDYELPFTFKDVSIEEDVEGKIDFVIHIKEHARGVHTEAVGDVGVQFTTSDSHGVEARKKRQLRHAAEHDVVNGVHLVEDRVLVQIPMAHVDDTVEAWQRKKKDVGGSPDMLWSTQLQHDIFCKVLAELPAHLEVDAERLWRDMVHSERQAA